MSQDRSFRERLKAGERLSGAFLKTPAPHLVEICAAGDCDFVAPDMEHAPLELGTLDLMIGFAGRPGLPVLPRLPSHDPSLVGRLLDAGAAGVLAPHVSSPAQAEAIVAASRFFSGKRGFSPSPRAGGYGTSGTTPHLKRSEAQTIVAVQIEDARAVEAIAEIAAVPGLDALFVGPADLSMSMKVAPDAPELASAIAKTVTVGKAAGLACGIFSPTASAAAKWAQAGYSWFIIGSDQSHLSVALRAEMAAMRATSATEYLT